VVSALTLGSSSHASVSEKIRRSDEGSAMVGIIIGHS